MSQASPSIAAKACSYVPPSPFVCGWEPDGSESALIHLRGELDLSTLRSFEETLRNAQLHASTVSIDLRELEFIDCAALGVVFTASAAARQSGGSLVLVRGSGQVNRVLKLTDLL